MKYLLVSAAATIVLATAVAWYVFYERTSPTPTIEAPVGLPVATDVPLGADVSSSSVNTLAGTEGAVLTVSDFLHDPRTSEDPVNPGYYLLGLTQDSPFAVTYIRSTQYFNIDLTAEPVGESRRMAERFLQNYLGLSEQGMCQLNYTLSVSTKVNESFAGTNLGFSFCPGATELP